jgi:hypothetical protein
MNISVAVATGILSLGLVTLSAQAVGGNPTLSEDYSLRLGAAFLGGETKVSSQLHGGNTADEIDFDQLGIDGDETSIYAGGRWRFAERWRLDLEYFGTSHEGSGIATTDLDFGDVTIPAGLAAQARFDLDVYAVSVGWSFIKDANKELGVGLGIHIADMSAEVAGAGFIGGTAVPFASESTSATAPLPNLRLYGGYAFNSDWAVEAGLGYFSLSYDKYDGQLLTATAAVEWRPYENFGIGAGYTYFDVDLEVDESNRTDNYNFRLNGPMLYLVTGF